MAIINSDLNLQSFYPADLEIYQIDETEKLKVLEQIAEKRKCFLKGEQLDLRKASNLFIDDFRSGRIGHITLEHPVAEIVEE